MHAYLTAQNNTCLTAVWEYTKLYTKNAYLINTQV